jgi:large subunit ribosomal protein L16
MRQTLNRKLKKTGKLWVRVFPDIPRSQKPAEVRMGKGKGGVSFWTSQIAAGQVLFEINTSSPELALQATKTISRMASLPVGLIKKEQPQ